MACYECHVLELFYACHQHCWHEFQFSFSVAPVDVCVAIKYYIHTLSKLLSTDVMCLIYQQNIGVWCLSKKVSDYWVAITWKYESGFCGKDFIYLLFVVSEGANQV